MVSGRKAGDVDHEQKDISTEQNQKSENPRVSCPDGNGERKKSPIAPKSKRPEELDCIRSLKTT
jgi:hypothetical protein